MVSQGISPVDVSSINYVIVQRRLIKYDPKNRRYWEERRGIEISELFDNGEVNKVFQFNPRACVMEGSLKRSKNIQEISDSFGISPEELSEEIDTRKEVLASLKNKSFDETVHSIQSALFAKGFGRDADTSDIIEK